MKEKNSECNDNRTLTARDVYRINTTSFRRRKLDRRFVGAAIAFLLILSIVGVSLFYIFSGRSRVPNRRAKIIGKEEACFFVEPDAYLHSSDNVTRTFH